MYVNVFVTEPKSLVALIVTVTFSPTLSPVPIVISFVVVNEPDCPSDVVYVAFVAYRASIVSVKPSV